MASMIQKELPPQAPYASLAGGYFWTLETRFRQLGGVLFTRPGYEGGRTENPTPEDVDGGETGHAETVEVYYDPKIITYKEILLHFLTEAHDPTQLNRQGDDVGTQYRSAIFYHDEDQLKQAQEVLAQLEAEDSRRGPIVTTLEPQTHFWPMDTVQPQISRAL